MSEFNCQTYGIINYKYKYFLIHKCIKNILKSSLKSFFSSLIKKKTSYSSKITYVEIIDGLGLLPKERITYIVVIGLCRVILRLGAFYDFSGSHRPNISPHNAEGKM